MRITLDWLKEQNACREGYEWSVKRLKGGDEDVVSFIQALLDEDHESWARWTIVRVFDYKQRIQWAVFSAELVIGHYEKKYPNSLAPRKAIEEAKKCIDNPTPDNKKAAYAAADAAYAAACAAACAAAYAAANAAADAAAYAAAGARAKTVKSIFKFGFSLIIGKEEVKPC